MNRPAVKKYPAAQFPIQREIQNLESADLSVQAPAKFELILNLKTRMAKKLNLQESRVVISCLYSLTACRPVEF
jgi:hypothetical protein